MVRIIAGTLFVVVNYFIRKLSELLYGVIYEGESCDSFATLVIIGVIILLINLL